jgi:GT2 family glycosyltransferase
MSEKLTDARTTGAFTNLRRRVYLTYQYFGLRTILFRTITFPLRFTPLQRHLRLRTHARDQELRRAVVWYEEHGRPVDIVIPSYRDAVRVRALVRTIRKTVPAGMARVIVADDCSGSDHLAALRGIKGIDVVVSSERNRGFAATANRGMREARDDRDVVLLNSDVEALPSWLHCLQYAAYRYPDNGIVGAQLQYPDGRIQFGGSVRNRDQPQWFDHRYRFKPNGWGPADQSSPALAVTGACMYVRRTVIDSVGLLDEQYPMAYEDVDWCLRAWQAGFWVLYFPAAQLVHHESVTRGTELGARERSSQELFWERWTEFFDGRVVAARREHATAKSGLQIIYVTEDTGVGGGHRDVFEHLDRLAARGHDVALYTLGEKPDWFPLRAAVRSFEDYHELSNALAEVDAIKVATWWMTAVPVWRASIPRGIPVYFVQDIETSYYPDHERARHAVLDSYRPEFRYMTISSWNRERLRELDIHAELVPPGIDLDTFQPRSDVRRREDMVLALGRSNPLKNLPLTLGAWRALQPSPELCLFGIEPELASEPGIRYVEAPDDARVNELLNETTVFVQTSKHEGFALPPLEAMAAGAAVVCTDAHGNRDFCVDEHNCLMPEPELAAVSAAIARLIADPQLRERLARAGVETASEYAWDRRIDTLEAWFDRVALAGRMAVAGELPPEAVAAGDG